MKKRLQGPTALGCPTRSRGGQPITRRRKLDATPGEVGQRVFVAARAKTAPDRSIRRFNKPEEDE